LRVCSRRGGTVALTPALKRRAKFMPPLRGEELEPTRYRVVVLTSSRD
jgi:hypothetical protein